MSRRRSRRGDQRDHHCRHRPLNTRFYTADPSINRDGACTARGTVQAGRVWSDGKGQKETGEHGPTLIPGDERERPISAMASESRCPEPAISQMRMGAQAYRMICSRLRPNARSSQSRDQTVIPSQSTSAVFIMTKVGEINVTNQKKICAKGGVDGMGIVRPVDRRIDVAFGGSAQGHQCRVGGDISVRIDPCLLHDPIPDIPVDVGRQECVAEERRQSTEYGHAKDERKSKSVRGLCQNEKAGERITPDRPARCAGEADDVVVILDDQVSGEQEEQDAEQEQGCIGLPGTCLPPREGRGLS